jgi:hypothetical protein
MGFLFSLLMGTMGRVLIGGLIAAIGAGWLIQSGVNRQVAANAAATLKENQRRAGEIAAENRVTARQDAEYMRRKKEIRELYR